MRVQLIYLDRVGLVCFDQLEVAAHWTVRLLRSVGLAPVVHGNSEGQTTKMLAHGVKVSLLDRNLSLPNLGFLVVRVIQLEEIRVEIRPGVVDFVGEDHHFSSTFCVVRAEADLRNSQGWT